MTRAGGLLRLAVYALALAALIGPQVLSLRRSRGRHRTSGDGSPGARTPGRRTGRGALAGRLPVLMHRLCLRLYGVRVTVEGSPPSPGEATLVLANHLSWLDIPVLGALLPLSFVAKREVAAWPVVGALARLQRTVFVDRERRSRTAAVNAELAGRLGAGEVIVLFAEGTTGDGNRLLPFRASLVGAARAALGEGVEGAGQEGGGEGGAVDGLRDGPRTVRLQPLAITYRARHGLPLSRAERPDVAWYGDTELAPHVLAFLRGGPLDAHVVWGEPIAFGPGDDRKRATALAFARVRRHVQEAVTGRPAGAEASPLVDSGEFGGAAPPAPIRPAPGPHPAILNDAASA